MKWVKWQDMHIDNALLRANATRIGRFRSRVVCCEGLPLFVVLRRPPRREERLRGDTSLAARAIDHAALRGHGRVMQQRHAFERKKGLPVTYNHKKSW